MTAPADLAFDAPQHLREDLRSAEQELQRLRGLLTTTVAFIHNPAYDLSARTALAQRLLLPAPRTTKPGRKQHMAKPGTQMGPENPNWKGGRTVAAHGYVLIRRPGHPRADCRGYVYEHLLVAEEKIGRTIRPSEQVHHKNHNRGDNRPENLEVKASAAHHGVEHRKRTDLRMPDEPNPKVTCECGCGAVFSRYDATNRPRRFVPGHNLRSISQAKAVSV